MFLGFYLYCFEITDFSLWKKSVFNQTSKLLSLQYRNTVKPYFFLLKSKNIIPTESHTCPGPIKTAWLRSRGVRVLNWPTCSTDLSPNEDIWDTMKG